MTVIGTNQNFKSEVLDFKGHVLVDFWATWCGPCQMLSPLIEQIGVELKDTVKVVKVDVDQENDLAMKYNVSAIPTVILFKDGAVKDTIIGFHQKQDYIVALQK